jgi:histidine triad (HIT) family protein/ATP adenylyltransferase
VTTGVDRSEASAPSVVVPGWDNRPMPAETRIPFDIESYVMRVRSGPCFLCRIARRDPSLPHHEVFRDERHVAFLPNFHVLWGYVLVAPLAHREAVVRDFPLDDYLALQALVHRVGQALTAVVPTERLYVLSLGSQQGNAHVHWHVAALPPGVRYADQQFRALMAEQGVLDVSPDEQAELAERLRRELAGPPPATPQG